jgi:osmotically-inducible protein OsmY
LNDDRRGDAELRGDVLQALMLDSIVPKTIDAKVANGFVTLTGTAEWQYQRDEADHVVSNIVGALDVFDEIDVQHPDPDADAIKGGIESALERNARIDGHRLHVKTTGGTVRIKGSVSSWAEHDQAIAAAWAAPGVRHVEDRIDVEY